MQTPQQWRGRRRVAGMVAVAAATVLTLGGCVGAPSSAAEVDDTVITEDLLDSTVQGAAEALGAGPDEINQKAVLASLIQGAVVDELVQDSTADGGAGLEITQADRRAAAESQPQLQQLLAVPAAAPLAEALIDLSLVQQQLGPEAFQEAFLAVPVQVNPRWGTWDPTSQEGLTGTGSLSVESYTG